MISYQVLALLPPHVNASFCEVAASLELKFRPLSPRWQIPDIVIGTDHIKLAWSNWSLRLFFAVAPHVLIESKEIAAAKATHRADRDIIASCDRRIEITSDPDPKMDHFNDYIFVLEVLERIPGVVLFDPYARTFMLE